MKNNTQCNNQTKGRFVRMIAVSVFAGLPAVLTLNANAAEPVRQQGMEQEAVAYISKSNGDIINPYKEIYDYLAEVKTHPPSADRDLFIGAIRQSLDDNMISLSEYVFLQTKYAEYQNKTWKMRLLADLSKQKR